MKLYYIVTGATGFLASEIVRQLVAQGKSVRALARSRQKAKKVFGSAHVELFYGDIREIESLTQMMNEGEEAEYVVIHAAAIVSIAKNANEELWQTNVGATYSIVNQLKKDKRVRRLVYVSSVHAQEEKRGEVMRESEEFDARKVVGGYAKSKAEATRYVLEATKDGLNAVVVQPSAIIGAGDFGQTHLTKTIIDYCQGKIPVAINGGYDMVDVKDVAKSTIMATCNGNSGDCFLLTNKYTTVRYFLETLYDITKAKKIWLTLPMIFAKISLPFFWIYYKISKKTPLVTSYSLMTLGSNVTFDHSKAQAVLGHNPKPLSQSLKEAVDFLREQNRI